jgi:hypothetical protein
MLTAFVINYVKKGMMAWQDEVASTQWILRVYISLERKNDKPL